MTTRRFPYAVALTILLAVPSTRGQVFTGANAPGAAMTFQVSIGPAATNISFTVPGNGSAYSYVQVKAGSEPTDVSYDFISHLQGKTNVLNLERPEVAATNYFVRVRTPSTSLPHAFTLIVETNRPGFRTAARPVAKPLGSLFSGLMTNLQKEYFQVEIPSNTTWRVVSTATNVVPDLYVRAGQLPTETAFLRRSLAITNDVVAFLANETAGGTYYLGAFAALAGNFKSSYAMRIETFSAGVLDWDSGSTPEGTLACTNVSGLAADYYFKIVTANPGVGGWRTVLNVWSGDANLYLRKGSLPSPESFDFKSDRPGSDGFVLSYGTQFNPSEEWYILVRAKAGAQWALVSGTPYVQDLGVVMADGSASSGEVVIGGEGARFFRTTIPDDMKAWSLRMIGPSPATNTISLKQASIPFPDPTDSLNPLTRAGRVLVVPPFLETTKQYFVRVDGMPGSTMYLDSRHQPITSLSFNASVTNAVAGLGYATYQITVPPAEIAWQLALRPLEGNPNFALRKSLVPNEDINSALSEQVGDVVDNITLVPDTLSDGTYYLTVYSTNDYGFRYALESGAPVITEINFTSATLNTDPDRVGWRFFRLSDSDQQSGKLGWDLHLTNESPGTRLAVRSSKVPGTWYYRNPDLKTAAWFDALSTGSYLQRPAQQVGTWYVGVWNPSNALGSFTLVTSELVPAPLTNAQPVSRANVPPGRWDYYVIHVPPDILGWDLRLTNVTAGQPKLYVRRGYLPDLAAAKLDLNKTTWTSGHQTVADNDWTKRPKGTDDTDETGRILVTGMGRPLEPGTYYVGVRADDASTESSYELISRWIGSGEAVPVVDLPWSGSVVTNTLSPREAAYYRVVLPAGQRSWKLRMQTLEGEAMLVVATNWIPHMSSEKRMQMTGVEHYTRLPAGGMTALGPGTNFVVIVGEGVAPSPQSVGPGTSTYLLELKGAMPETNHLGTLGLTALLFEGQLEAGEISALHFNSSPTLRGFKASIENLTGTVFGVSRCGSDLARLNLPYGNEGGAIGGSNFTTRLLVSDPCLEETVMMQASTNGDSAYRLRLTPIIPEPLAFDGGSLVKFSTNGVDGDYFYLDVPADAIGWDLRLVNVTTGSPKLVVRRDYIGVSLTTFGLNWLNPTEWPSGSSWAADLDWTERRYSAAGEDEQGRLLAMGMNRPLEPGRYYVTVFGGGSGTNAYTLQSRGIGAGFTIPVTNLAFAGGQATVTGLPAREAAYFQVQIPSNTPSWKVRLTGSGETLLAVEQGALPSVRAHSVQTVVNASSGKKMQKLGDEHFVLLPPAGSNYLTAGSYYLMVVSEGAGAASGDQVGASPVDFTLTSLGAAPVVDLGQLSATNATLVRAGELPGGDTVFYRFTAVSEITSLDARLTTTNGYPVMVLTKQDQVPYPGAGGSGVVEDKYGTEGGITSDLSISASAITLLGVTNSTYTVAVKARPVAGAFTNAGFTLRITGRVGSAQPIAFDGGGETNYLIAPGGWRFYQVEVPTNALGWDLRLLDGGTNTLTMVVRRDNPPTQAKTLTAAGGTWSAPGTATSWPSNYQWAASADWTRRTYSALGTNESGHVLAMGMGMPLEPGTYFIGVTNLSRFNTVAYTLLSRGIGDGLSIPVTEVTFTNGSATQFELMPREAAYYRVEVPTNAPRWKLRLRSLGGESMMAVLRGFIPNVDSVKVDGTVGTGKGMQRLGDDHFLLLPPAGQSNIQAGTYYVVVVSEGLNPANDNAIGRGASSFSLESIGPVTSTPLGLLTSADLVMPDSLEGGEVKAYQFVVPPGMLGFRARLDVPVASPTLVLRPGTQIPDPGAVITGSLAKDSYGNEGGETTSILGHSNTVLVARPAPGNYTIAVKARATESGVYPDATYTLRLQELLVPEINFSSELGTNGLTNVVTGLLANNERVFFKVQIPESLQGQSIIGWKLELSQSSGVASMRVGKDGLPSDASASAFPPFAESSAIIVPPFLTNGTWYVEVRGSNATAFTLTSSALQLDRSAWTMPSPGDPNVAPGLQWPVFGNSEVDSNGAPTSAEGSTAIGQGAWHYYAVDVPANNGGLLRCELDAISGNPDLYVRAEAPPTLTHNVDGKSGAVYERLLSGGGNGVANWVPLEGRLESALKSGRWYLAVRAAGGINARYRLRVSVGDVTDLALHGTPVTGQSVNSNDWRYYRIQVPVEVPFNFNLTYSATPANVVVHLRDTVPPGNSTNLGRYCDWLNDNKNSGPYPAFSTNGTYTLSTPPLRPGTTYYIGVRGTRDATFNLNLSTNALAGVSPEDIDFYGGFKTNTLPPYSQVLYRILAPPEATRWYHTSLHSTNVLFFLEQGTVPIKGTGDDWRSTISSPTANASLNRSLVVWNDAQKQYLPADWPWVAGQAYYLIVSNKSAAPHTFEFRMQGSNQATDNSDQDSLPDAWELYYFGKLTTANDTTDSDGDGVKDLDEFREGTNPVDGSSFQPRLTLVPPTNGLITVTPDWPSYPPGTEIFLTPVPATNYAFVRWLGDAQGRSQPLRLVMDVHKTISAEFKLTGDDLVTAQPILGTAALIHSTNVSYTKESGEPYHAGNPGGKSIWWAWTAPVSGQVTFSTAGSAFTTLLAAYTGSSVSALTRIASDVNSLGGTNRSRITFAAAAGTPYYIAVDGFDGASSWITLTMSMDLAPPVSLTLESVEVLGTTATLQVRGPSATPVILDASTNLIHWAPILTNTTGNDGAAVFVDPAASRPEKFYRGRLGTSP